MVRTGYGSAGQQSGRFVGVHRHTQRGFYAIPATNKAFKTTFMNFYYFNEKGQITNDVADVGMIGIIQALKA